jgi:hypothetical protein
MQTSNTDRRSNPFATRWVRPGAIPYLFPDGIDVLDMVNVLRRNDWQAAIVGPHGSGKSTLLATLIPELRSLGHDVRLIELHDGRSRIPRKIMRSARPQLMVVDGYEQLSRWSRWRFPRVCRSRRRGFLVTAHDEASTCGIPTLIRTSGDLATVERIVNQYLPAHGGLIDRADVANAFLRHQGNARETLFELYDVFDQRSRHS